MDVDIKDYDSTTKDDDIDHLYYTFKSVPNTEKVTVVLNGTKVRYVNCLHARHHGIEIHDPYFHSKVVTLC